MAPVLVMALGLGIEVSRWSVAKVELQRIADAAALAGAFDYQHQTTKVPGTAAAAASNLAEINGITGQITVQIGAGLKNASDTAVQVTVSRSLRLFLAQIFTAATSLTISATAVAELVPTATSAACLLALQGDLNGITTNPDVSISNGVHIATQGCALRSDGDVNLTGGATVNGNVIAAGQVSVSNGASITTPYAATSNDGQVGDPFATDAAVQNALQAAATATGSADSCTSNGSPSCTLSPGNFTGISVSNGATLTLAPGLYTVNGPVDFDGGTVNIEPGGVSIVSSGPVTVGNGVSVNGFSAATPGSAGVAAGAIPGVLLATSASGSNAATFNGGANFLYTGVIYVPNGTVSISDGVSASTPGCAEVIANEVDLAGGATFASNTCSQTFGTALPEDPRPTNDNSGACAMTGRRFLHARRAVAAIEFALVSPMLLAFIGGLVDFGLALADRSRLAGAVAQGAQYAYLNPTTVTTSAIQAIIVASASLPGMTASNVSVTGPSFFCVAPPPPTLASTTGTPPVPPPSPPPARMARMRDLTSKSPQAMSIPP